MKTTVTTTITTDIDLETFEPTHSVDISAEEGIPAQVIYAAAYGACREAFNSLEDSVAGVQQECEDDETGEDPAT